MKARIISIWIIGLLFLTLFSSACAETNLPRAVLVSYDYSSNTNFGTGYQTSMEIQRHGNNGSGGRQIRLWLRIHLFMPSNDVQSSFQQNVESMNITLVNIESACSIQYGERLLPVSSAIPAGCSLDLIDDPYDDWAEYWNRLFPNWVLHSPYPLDSYWSQSLKSGETEWILELLLNNNGESEEEIRRIVNSLKIKCSVSCNLNGEEIWVENGHAQREIRYDEKAVQFKADSFDEVFFENPNEKSAYLTDAGHALICSNDAYARTFFLDPEQYALVDISITMLKQMPWAVCNVEASITSNDTFIGVFTESSDSMDEWGQWKNGFYTLVSVSVVVKKDGMNEQQLKDALRDLELYLTFSTEFAGENDFSRIGSNGCPGVRFTTRVDMTELLTLNEITEKLRDICDG